MNCDGVSDHQHTYFMTTEGRGFYSKRRGGSTDFCTEQDGHSREAATDTEKASLFWTSLRFRVSSRNWVRQKQICSRFRPPEQLFYIICCKNRKVWSLILQKQWTCCVASSYSAAAGGQDDSLVSAGEAWTCSRTRSGHPELQQKGTLLQQTKHELQSSAASRTSNCEDSQPLREHSQVWRGGGEHQRRETSRWC